MRLSWHTLRTHTRRRSSRSTSTGPTQAGGGDGHPGARGSRVTTPSVSHLYVTDIEPPRARPLPATGWRSRGQLLGLGSFPGNRHGEGGTVCEGAPAPVAVLDLQRGGRRRRSSSGVTSGTTVGTWRRLRAEWALGKAPSGGARRRRRGRRRQGEPVPDRDQEPMARPALGLHAAENGGGGSRPEARTGPWVGRVAEEGFCPERPRAAADWKCGLGNPSRVQIPAPPLLFRPTVRPGPQAAMRYTVPVAESPT